ncbi:carboxypeptidase-like regulatory domain-containing protein [Bdellovibrionota bacterium FG-2]
MSLFKLAAIALLLSTVSGCGGCSSAPDANPTASTYTSVDVTFNVTAPAETGAADVVAMRTGLIFGAVEEEHNFAKVGSTWILKLTLPKGFVLRYRYSLNSDWDKEESYRYRRGYFHYRELVANETMTVTETIGEWEHLLPSVERTGTLSGTITDSESGLPIVNAVVSSGPYQTHSGYGGHYRIKGAPAGTSLISVYLDDGAYRAQTASISVSTSATTTQDFQLTKATMRQVKFSAAAPADTPSGAILRVMGDRQRLGLFGASEGTAFDSTRVIDLTATGGRWEYTTTLGDGNLIQYLYTLGDSQANFERDAAGVGVVRIAAVDGADVTLTDAPVAWKTPTDVALALNVTAPTSDTVYVSD